MSDEEDVIQALVVLQLTNWRGIFELITVAGTWVLIRELVFKLLKLLKEQICLISTKNDINIFKYILWYVFMMTALITPWRQKVLGDNANMVMLP